MVLGAGATGVVLQALQALTGPGDAIAFASPTFDGYPIIAQMARLNPVSVPLDQHGHNDLDGLADAAATARVVVVCRPHNPTGTLEPTAEIVSDSFGGCRATPSCCSTRRISNSPRPSTGSTFRR